MITACNFLFCECEFILAHDTVCDAHRVILFIIILNCHFSSAFFKDTEIIQHGIISQFKKNLIPDFFFLFLRLNIELIYLLIIYLLDLHTYIHKHRY